MTGGYNDLGLVGIRNQVHGTSHALEDPPGDHVVGQVTVGTDLQGLFIFS